MTQMTVTELREMLEEMERKGHGETEVMFVYNYGDHWRTHVACGIDDVREEFVVYSEYHRMDKMVDKDDDEPGPEGSRKVIILS